MCIAARTDSHEFVTNQMLHLSFSSLQGIIAIALHALPRLVKGVVIISYNTVFLVVHLQVDSLWRWHSRLAHLGTVVKTGY